MKKAGFSLVEVIIASAVFLALVTSVFWIYNSITKFVMGGSWRLGEQKRAQQFLSELVRDLQRSNPSVVKIASSGEVLDLVQTPVFININYYSTVSQVPIPVNSTSWQCLMAFSIAKPFREANATFAVALDRGKWTGISLWGNSRHLLYIREDDPAVWTATPTAFPAGITPGLPPSGVSAGSDFEPSQDRIHSRIVHSAVEEFSIFGTGTPIGFLEIRAKFRKYSNGAPSKPPVQFEEVVAVKLATGSIVTTFVP